jgi:propanol-preferring alcohol dehydrogenase
MHAMVLHGPHEQLVRTERVLPAPAPDELLIRVEACGVCRTDLHLVDGELPQARYPIVPGHEVVGTVKAVGTDVQDFKVGERVGVPWLGWTCGRCEYCLEQRENLCDFAQFTGCSLDGGYATHMVAKAAYGVRLDARWPDPVAAAPLLCAGLIGWRALNAAGACTRLGIYGFGAAAHIVTQLACWQGARIFAFTRPGDLPTQAFARSLGASWAGDSDRLPPDRLDAAILFAPVGELVPLALQAVRKGGRVVCAGIHMSDIPRFPYRWLWEERTLVSVANLTRNDARTYLDQAYLAGVRTHTTRYPLSDANRALQALRSGDIEGAAVLVPEEDSASPVASR